ncbi:carotenoid oxygenase family protein [Waterburya agarophytonicola K14]|uniref:Carotenoid oxygenase family protein n=1 Tax=Waterburya agarophytonicola KI4 TaxID=2874699 RepID=A0A964FGF9_9CYAN|nr:carotenoid oxygenase family protein [Waterburya agarophytonicola]MCC0176564.1 carotenoid oxygenase family protein [Waterburya agarophytonicola KI4]
MITTSKQKAWSKAIAKPGVEFDRTALSIISGAIPTDLKGTLYRNGPARLSRGEERVGHWFDGDGAILGVRFEDGGGTATYRYVQTQGYLDEEEQDSFIYPNYGMTAKGAFWNNWLKSVKNAGNTSVLALPDRLLALWEGGKPHALDLDNLTTSGIDELSGLTQKQSFSAHPKVDASTGEIFNYGVSAGATTTLNLYRCDRTGKLQHHNSHSLSGLPIIHDFCLAGQYMVFLVSPVRVNLVPVLLGQKSYSDAMEWKPQLGTEILIFNRQTLKSVSRGATDPWFQWHFSNGCVNEEGNIVTEFIRYENFDTNQYLKEVASGCTQTPAKGTLWQLTIDPQTARVIENQQLSNTAGEFPLVAPQNVGKPWRYTYLNVHRYGVTVGEELFNAIASFDRQTHNMAIADMGKNCYPSEPVIVPQKDNPERGWLLTVVYDGNTDRSEVRIYQSDRLFDAPVCRLGLPSVIPPGFHGTWKQD